MGRLTRHLAAALAALSLAACGEDRATTTDTSARIPGPTDTVVVYERTGGEVQVRERLDVRPDGAAQVVTLQGERRFQLSPGELDALRAARGAAEAVRLRPVYGTSPAPLDSYEQTVWIGPRSVRVLPGGKPPKELRRLLELSADLVRRHAPR